MSVQLFLYIFIVTPIYWLIVLKLAGNIPSATGMKYPPRFKKIMDLSAGLVVWIIWFFLIDKMWNLF